MDAWQVLTENSLAPIGSDAWVHLNNQNVGSGGSGETIIGAVLVADIDSTLEAEIGEILSADLLMTELTANIVENSSAETDGDLGANI